MTGLEAGYHLNATSRGFLAELRAAGEEPADEQERFPLFAELRDAYGGSACNLETTCYTDIPRWYRWEGRSTSWVRRRYALRGGDIVARLVNVSPRDIERYALRLLLMHVPGATCEKELRTVGGARIPIVQACRRSTRLGCR